MAWSQPFSRLFAMFAVFLTLLPLIFAETQFITAQNSNGQTVRLADDRKPALYTDNFGSCLDQGLVDITRFDAALYADNMTLIFEFAGNTNLTQDSVVSEFFSFACKELFANAAQSTSVSLPMARVDSSCLSTHVGRTCTGKASKVFGSSNALLTSDAACVRCKAVSQSWPVVKYLWL